MLLAIDIGNSNIAIGVYERQWIEHWRICTEAKRTADEYRIQFHNLLDQSTVTSEQIDSIVISSVVPELASVIGSAAARLCAVEPYMVGAGSETGLDKESIPGEIGCDLLANAASAHEKYPDRPCMVIDFGTALTFTTVSSIGAILGVAIAPGVGSAVGALSSNTAQLPHVDLRFPSSVLGRDTIHSIQAGVLFGYKGLVSQVIEQTERELQMQLTVIATGGFSHVLAPELPRIDLLDPWHTLDGLKHIYDLNNA
ncbi:MAG: type III pantothenate kinase [Spirochaetota bacterium]